MIGYRTDHSNETTVHGHECHIWPYQQEQAAVNEHKIPPASSRPIQGYQPSQEIQ